MSEIKESLTYLAAPFKMKKNPIVQINTLNTLSSQYWHLKTIVAILIIVTVWSLGVLCPLYANFHFYIPDISGGYKSGIVAWNWSIAFPILITFQNKTYIILNEIND